MHNNYGDEPERVCELECRGLQGLPARHEFVGPVKIVLIESTPMDYRRKVCWSAMIALALLFLPLPAFIIMLYTLTFKIPFLVNLHVFLGSMIQLFMVYGILMHSTFFGGAMFLNATDRRFQHLLLQSAAVICGVIGTVLMAPYLSCSFHSLTGLFGALFAVFASILGPGAYFSSPSRFFGRFNRKIHMFFALPAFILSTFCFMTVFGEPKFVRWLGIKYLEYILLVMTFFYLFCVLGSVYIKFKNGY